MIQLRISEVPAWSRSFGSLQQVVVLLLERLQHLAIELLVDDEMAEAAGPKHGDALIAYHDSIALRIATPYW